MKRIILISFVITGLFFSCQKSTTDNNDDAKLKQDIQENSNEEPCFDFVYPVTYIMPDGTAITGNSKEELVQAIKSWYVANPGSKDKPTLQYPVDVNFKGRIITIENDAGMKRIKSACEEEKEPCFTMVYPITLVMPDGTTITGNSREELGIAIRTWYAENPGIEVRPTTQYPVEVNFKERVITVNNDDEMKRIKEACKEEKKPCFVFVYPITYTMPDGTVYTVESTDDDETKKAIRAWYVENPGVEEKPAIQYPIEIKFRDGKTLTINNDEELKKAWASCD